MGIKYDIMKPKRNGHKAAAGQIRTWRAALGMTQQQFGNFIWPKLKGSHNLQGRIAKYENSWSDLPFSLYVQIRDKCERAIDARTK